MFSIFIVPLLAWRLKSMAVNMPQDEQKEIDLRRDQWLSANGVRMLRFWNNEVLSNLQGVLQTIVMELEKKTPSRREERADLPLSGGGDGTDTP